MRMIYLAAFGVLGVFCRYGVGLLVTRLAPGPFPAATLLINLAGSFLIGVVYVLGMERSTLSEPLRLALAVGFLGGFTTFSAYALEITRLLENGRPGLAALYLAASTVGGVAAASLGLLVARQYSPT